MRRAVALSIPVVASLLQGPWSDITLPPEERAKQLVAAMTLEEKLQMLHGVPGNGRDDSQQCRASGACAYVGNIQAIQRLGIPPVTMNDGPQGFRDDAHPGTSTAWPSGLTMAASWDVDAMYDWGSGMGKEFVAKGSNVQLGPGVNVARVPLNGRNFEYLSGEDPFLGYTLVQPAVKGIQSQKVVADAKHYVLNNQETNRGAVSSEIDERTLFELYYPPFEGAIEANVGSFMCGYNKINKTYSCENPTTLGHNLKEVLGFKGYVMSDWGATHSTSIMAGLDVEMPGQDFMNEDAIKAGLVSGSITQAAVDEAVTRILWSMFLTGVMDEPVSTWDWRRLQNNVTTPEAVALARRLSAISTVLLRNDDGILPLQKGKRIAVLGLADSNAIVHAGGSGSVVPSFVTTPLMGIQAAAGNDAHVEFALGDDINSAAQLAADSDYAVIFVGTLSSEGSDRKSLSLDDGTKFAWQNQLISAVAEKAGHKTVVVASVPGAILMPWSLDVAAILTNFMPGQEAGNAIADILFGETNPSAKLPLTFPNIENETQFSQAQYPGVPDPKTPEYAFYTEKLLIGYRYYDAHGIDFSTGFPFGHGLSYTSFQYDELKMEPTPSGYDISFVVKNVGSVAGAEVAQLYLSFPQAVGEPLWQLKGFQKTKVLGVGESQTINLFLRPRDLSIWNSDVHAWTPVSGVFKVNVGSSSRDTRLSSSFQWTGAKGLEKVFV